jgi:FMN phosphatase YigB (HAD superfamily)
VKPEECLFMDDSLANVIGAEKVGMLAIHWDTHKNGLIKFKKTINF